MILREHPVKIIFSVESNGSTVCRFSSKWMGLLRRAIVLMPVLAIIHVAARCKIAETSMGRGANG
jgi:hypothetical protein